MPLKSLKWIPPSYSKFRGIFECFKFPKNSWFKSRAVVKILRAMRNLINLKITA